MLEAFYRWVTAQAGSVLLFIDGKIPEVPGEVASSCAVISDVMGQVSFLRYFFPFEAVAAGIGIVLLGVLTGIVLKLVRIVASFGTLGGGAV